MAGPNPLLAPHHHHCAAGFHLVPTLGSQMACIHDVVGPSVAYSIRWQAALGQLLCTALLCWWLWLQRQGDH